MNEFKWMLYGATGFTGKLIIQEAVAAGLRPTIAGRSEEALQALAKQYDLDYQCFSLESPPQVALQLKGFQAVYHAAGPFIYTSETMVQACLLAGVHYLDITGEISILKRLFELDEPAKQRGIAILPGVGFDVIPTNCMAKYVADQLPDATRLYIGIAGMTQVTAGTSKSFVEMLPEGAAILKDGVLESHPYGYKSRKIRFSDKEHTATLAPWGDIYTAYPTTGIPNISAYMAMSPVAIQVVKFAGGFGQWLFAHETMRKITYRLIETFVKGPSQKSMDHLRSYIWVRAENETESVEAWLETIEAYAFTAKAAVKVMERLSTLEISGVHAPAMAFGADFVLEIEGSQRFDQLPA